MSKQKQYRHLVKATAELFYRNEAVFSVSASPNAIFPYPRLYAAYNIGAAAVDAIIDADLGFDLRRTIRLKTLLEEAVELREVNAEKISSQREIQAIALNNYGGLYKPFNPN